MGTYQNGAPSLAINSIDISSAGGESLHLIAVTTISACPVIGNMNRLSVLRGRYPVLYQIDPPQPTQFPGKFPRMTRVTQLLLIRFEPMPYDLRSGSLSIRPRRLPGDQ